MHIVFLGNTCNNSYNIAKSIRAAGHDCTLYYDPLEHPQTFPEMEDPEVKDSAPLWIRQITHVDKTAFPWDGPSDSFLKLISQADIIHCEGMYLLWAQKAGVPYYWFPYGGDSQLCPRWSHWCDSDCFLAGNALRYLDAAVNAAGINFVQNLSTKHYFKSYILKHFKGVVSKLFFPINTDKFSPIADVSLHELLSSKGVECLPEGIIVFNPTRIMFTAKQSYDYGSDLLLEALTCLKAKGVKFTLLICDRGAHDENTFKALAQRLGIYENIISLPFIPRSELAQWYSASDVVTNEFRHGSLGSVAFEALACGTPLLTCVPKEFNDCASFCISAPPIYTSTPLESAVAALEEVAHNPDKARQKGLESRQWALDNVSYSSVARKFIDCYEECIVFSKGLRAPLSYPEMPVSMFKAFVTNELQGSVEDLKCIVSKLDTYPTDFRLIEILVRVLEREGYRAGAANLVRQVYQSGLNNKRPRMSVSWRSRLALAATRARICAFYFLRTTPAMRPVYVTLRSMYRLCVGRF